MKKTLYQILEVDSTASAQAIAAAYKRLAAMAETDWSDPNTPVLLRQAKEILLDARQRSNYDASLAARATHSPADPDRKPESMMVGGWGKWIAIAALIGAAMWWATRRGPPPAPAMPPPPLALSQTSKPAPKPAVQAPDQVPDSTDVEQAARPVEVTPTPACAVTSKNTNQGAWSRVHSAAWDERSLPRSCTKDSSSAPAMNSARIARMASRGLPLSAPATPISTGPSTAANLPSML